MIKLTTILNEMRVNERVRLLTDEDIKALNIIAADFNDSGFDLYEPMSETYRLKDYEDLDDNSKLSLAFYHLY